MPNVLFACQKIGIVRATYYRWRATDPAFAQAADRALRLGHEGVADIAEMSMIKLAKKGSFPAAKFLAERNSDHYAPKARQSLLRPPDSEDFKLAHLNTDLTPLQRDVMYHWTRAENEELRKRLEQYEAPAVTQPPPKDDPP